MQLWALHDADRVSAHPHMDHRPQHGAWLMPDARRTLVIAVALFAAVFALQVADTTAADSDEVLYVVPIALLALRFGLQGGTVGALVGIGLTISRQPGPSTRRWSAVSMRPSRSATGFAPRTGATAGWNGVQLRRLTR